MMKYDDVFSFPSRSKCAEFKILLLDFKDRCLMFILNRYDTKYDIKFRRQNKSDHPYLQIFILS